MDSTVNAREQASMWTFRDLLRPVEPPAPRYFSWRDELQALERRRLALCGKSGDALEPAARVPVTVARPPAPAWARITAAALIRAERGVQRLVSLTAGTILAFEDALCQLLVGNNLALVGLPLGLAAVCLYAAMFREGAEVFARAFSAF